MYAQFELQISFLLTLRRDWKCLKIWLRKASRDDSGHAFNYAVILVLMIEDCCMTTIYKLFVRMEYHR